MESSRPFPLAMSTDGLPAGRQAIACPWCGQLHSRVTLKPGETSKCIRCEAVLATGRASNWIVTFAWVLTALALWLPANLLPIVTLSQLGNAHRSLLFSGVVGLWNHGMPWVAVLVALCGVIAPLTLLLSLTGLLLPIVLNRPTAKLSFLIRWLHAVELWSIPEVYLLAVLVAFIKLGAVVHAVPATGLWCHAAMALAMLVAWRRFDTDAAAEALATERVKGGVT